MPDTIGACRLAVEALGVLTDGADQVRLENEICRAARVLAQAAIDRECELPALQAVAPRLAEAISEAVGAMTRIRQLQRQRTEQRPVEAERREQQQLREQDQWKLRERHLQATQEERARHELATLYQRFGRLIWLLSAVEYGAWARCSTTSGDGSTRSGDGCRT